MSTGACRRFIATKLNKTCPGCDRVVLPDDLPPGATQFTRCGNPNGFELEHNTGERHKCHPTQLRYTCHPCHGLKTNVETLWKRCTKSKSLPPQEKWVDWLIRSPGGKPERINEGAIRAYILAMQLDATQLAADSQGSQGSSSSEASQTY